MMGDMLIYEANSGILKDVMDAEYITTLRTGAVAAHSALVFGKKDFTTIGLLGLGNIMTVCFETLLAVLKREGDNRKLTVKLYKHHDQEKRFAERFKNKSNVNFAFADTYPEVFNGADIIISAVIKATKSFAQDECFKEATNKPRTAFPDADVIFIIVPSFAMKKAAEVVTPLVKQGTFIGIIPGNGGGEVAFKDAIEKGAIVFGLQRVPSVARLVEYGKSVCATGYRKTLFAAALPKKYTEDACAILRNGLQMECEYLVTGTVNGSM